MSQKNPIDNTGLQFDFMKEYIEELLLANDVNLTEEQKSVYVPQLMTQAEQRLGIELLPKLSKESLEEFNDLIQADDTTDEQWKVFWSGALPTLEDDVKEILLKFTDEARDILNA